MSTYIVQPVSLVCQHLLHAFLRDLTNYYWHQEVQQENLRLNEDTLNGRFTDQAINSFCETVGDSNVEIKNFDIESDIKLCQTFEETRFETEDESNIGEKSKTTLNWTKTDCYEQNITVNETGNFGSVLFCDSLKTVAKEPSVSDCEGILSELSTEQKKSVIVKSTSYTIVGPNSSYTVVENSDGNNSLTFRDILKNNNQSPRDTDLPNYQSNSQKVFKEENVSENKMRFLDKNDLGQHNYLESSANNSYFNNELKLMMGNNSEVDYSFPNNDDCEMSQIKCNDSELFLSLIQMCSVPIETYRGSRTNSTESSVSRQNQASITIPKGTSPEQKAIGVTIQQDSSQALWGGKTLKEDKKSSDDIAEEAENISSTSDDVSHESALYEELVEKYLSTDIEEIEERCCTDEGHTCLPVVRWDEAEELLSESQMVSVDTDSQSDWLYSMKQSTRYSTSGKLRDVSGKKCEDEEELISKTLFTNKWVEDCRRNSPTSLSGENFGLLN